MSRVSGARAGCAALATIGMCLSLCASALATGDINRAECPTATESSPGFRSYMPDCRAYELVSPAFVNGVAPLGLEGDSAPQISADGEHVISKVLGGFAETGSLEQKGPDYGAIYEFSRAGAGWSVEALNPPASLYPRSEFEFASTNFSHSLWAVQPPAVAGQELPVGPVSGNGFSYPNNSVLVTREAAGGGKGRFTPVGPVAGPEHIPSSTPPGVGNAFYPEAASADLSHIVLSVEAEDDQLWPGDETDEYGMSLYEYVGTGNREPMLVGVRNEGPLHGAPYLNDGAELVSQCGTELGGQAVGGTLANAVSASGETVYFTARACGVSPSVNELYARLGGERTIAISEPTTGPAGNCEACDETAPASAVFQGASEDGTKVFFSSEQALLPGARGDSLYEFDFDAANAHERLTLLAPEIEGTATISQDGGRVYFQSSAVLAAAANGNGEAAGEPAQLGNTKTYVYDTNTGEPGFTGEPAFVAGQANVSGTTRDGQFMVFTSGTHIARTNDTSVVSQVFEYDAETGVNARVSVGQTSSAGYECEATHLVEAGFNCDGNATTGTSTLPYSESLSEGEQWAPTDATSGLAVAADGTVTFESTIALTPLAVPGKENVYEFRDGDVYLISPGVEAVGPVLPVAVSEGATRALGVSESGSEESGLGVFFASTEALVPQDVDSQTSWYDAREDGGFPAPTERASCEEGACQGALSAAPAFAAPTSNTLTASGNLAPPIETKPAIKPAAKPKAKPCKKGFVKRKKRCVKAPKSKKAKRAGTKRRAKS
jgi:hypothetical protein